MHPVSASLSGMYNAKYIMIITFIWLEILIKCICCDTRILITRDKRSSHQYIIYIITVSCIERGILCKKSLKISKG